MKSTSPPQAPATSATEPALAPPERAGAPSSAPANAASAASARRLQVRRSGVHGKGVFALRNLAAGEVLIEYTGQRISWDEALDRHPHDPANPEHTFYFQLENSEVIDALYGGNSSRWINHACNPNCEAEETAEGRVFIKALRDIAAGEELFYDYGLSIDERYTAALKRRYACCCGAPDCRGTMLAPKRRSRSTNLTSRTSRTSTSS